MKRALLPLVAMAFLLLHPCSSAQLSGCYLSPKSSLFGFASSASFTFYPNRISYTLRLSSDVPCVCIFDWPIISHVSTGTNQGTFTTGAGSVSSQNTCTACSQVLPTVSSYSISDNLLRWTNVDCSCKTTWSAPAPPGYSCVNQAGCASPACDADVSGPWCPTVGTCNHGAGTTADGQGFGYCSTVTNYVGSAPPSSTFSSVANSAYPRGACPSTDSGDSGDSNAVIIGVAVAVILLLLVGSFVTYFFYFRNDAMAKSADANSEALPPTSAVAPNVVTPNVVASI